MVRGNWQKRVEQASERKKSNQQRKNQANQLQALFNKYETNNDKSNENQNFVLIFQSSTATNSSKYCPAFFFRGECRSRKKCRLSHNMSLLDSLKFDVRDNAIDKEIVLCEDAAEKAQAELSLLCVEWNSSTDHSIVDREALVYIVADGKLVYDRYRGGVLKKSKVNDEVDEDFFNDSELQTTMKKLHYYKVDGDNKSVKLITNVPSVVLQHILLFLPDYYIGILVQVCKSWQLVGDSSSVIWKCLLENRNWNEAATKIDSKKLFISNYCIMRNMIAVQKGVQMIVDPKDRDVLFHSLNNACGTFEEIKDPATLGGAVQIFKSTLGSPSINDFCVSLSVMPKNTYYGDDSVLHSVFSAYEIDGTVRVFEPVADTRGKGLLCRQTACVRSILRSKGIKLKMMQMDDKYICCVADSTQDGIIFSVLWKDEVVCDSGGVEDSGVIDSDHFKVYHANDLVAEYNARDNRSQIPPVSCVQDKSLLSCGNGLFFVRLDTFPTDDGIPQELLCIFSARQGTIIFLEPRLLPVSMAVFSRRTQQSSCSVIQKNGRNFIVYHLTQEEDTQMKTLFSICALTAGFGHDCLEYSNIELIHCEQRSTRNMLLPFSSGFVEVNVLEGQINEVKVHQLSPLVAEFVDPFNLCIDGSILCVDQVSDDHLLIVSETINTADPLYPETTHALVINLLSHQIINKVYLGTRHATANPCKYEFAYSKNHDFLTCQVDCEAMILAGREVRSLHKSQIEQRKITSPGSESKKKKKNKRLASKTGKKDGFARGMSLRG